MERKVLIISNPGEQGDEHYCKGVLRDVENYVDYFKSPLGGGWNISTEIVLLSRPAVPTLRQELASLCKVDYSLIVFTGHGGYSEKSDSTILELRKQEHIDSSELRCGTKKRTIILDCCRSPINLFAEEVEQGKEIVAAYVDLDLAECRRYYKDAIENCDIGVIVAYSCSPDQKAYDSDSGKGGVYSYNLIRYCKDWARNQDLKDLRSQKKYRSLSIVKAHNEIADKVERETLHNSEGKQVPQILRPRSGKYFPFGIVV